MRGFFKFRNQVSRFAFLACAAAAAQLTDVSLAQNHCTAVTNLTAIPFGTNTCGSNYFTIRGTEVKGSHPVTADIGSTKSLQGVCAYTYSGCLANQYSPFSERCGRSRWCGSTRTTMEYGNEFRYKGSLNPGLNDKVNRVIYDVVLANDIAGTPPN